VTRASSGWELRAVREAVGVSNGTTTITPDIPYSAWRLQWYRYVPGVRITVCVPVYVTPMFPGMDAGGPESHTMVWPIPEVESAHTNVTGSESVLLPEFPGVLSGTHAWNEKIATNSRNSDRMTPPDRYVGRAAVI
jgi:hypothetical protein